MRSAAVLTMKPMLRASLPREPVRVAMSINCRTSLELDRPFWALGGRVLFGKLTQKSPLLLACDRLRFRLWNQCWEPRWRESQQQVTWQCPEGLLSHMKVWIEHSGARNHWEAHKFSCQKRFFATYLCGDPLHGLGVFCGVFSILGTWGSRIAPKSLWIQKFVSRTFIYFACFVGFCRSEMQFWGFNLNLHATCQLKQVVAWHLLPGYEVNFSNLNPS